MSGLALSDPLGITAQPLDVVEADERWSRSRYRARDSRSTEIVVGHPVSGWTVRADRKPKRRKRSLQRCSRSGQDSPSRRGTSGLSTKEAERVMRAGAEERRKQATGDRRQGRRAVILQAYLEQDGPHERKAAHRPRRTRRPGRLAVGSRLPAYLYRPSTGDDVEIDDPVGASTTQVAELLADNDVIGSTLFFRVMSQGARDGRQASRPDATT